MGDVLTGNIIFVNMSIVSEADTLQCLPLKKCNTESKLKTLPKKYLKYSRTLTLLLQIHASSLKTDKRQYEIQS